jgi:hypothetical protein
MKKKTVLFLIACFLFTMRAQGEHSSAAVYRQIQDIYHPTLQDYARIQEYLTSGKREGLEKLKDTEQRQRCFTLIGSAVDEKPRSGIIAVHCGIEDKENCLVLYASFNHQFRDGLKRIIQLVEQSDYKGHILYYIGGWPNLKEGSLALAHVPHAFKACALKEAQRLGYRRLLWLDSSVLPLVSLNTLFQIIEKKGYFMVGNEHSVGEYCNSQAAEYFGFSLEKTRSFLSCQSGFIGVDVTRDPGKKIVDHFYKAAQDENAFFSARSDQTALSLILHKLHLLDLADSQVAPFLRDGARPGAFFFVDRPFVRH